MNTASFPARAALVTGGAGFIGSHLVGRLLSEGWRVRVFDNLSSGRRDRLPAENIVEFVEGDIRDEAAVRRACTGAEVVFHLAALVSVVESVKSPELAEEINGQGTRHVFAGATAAGARRVVFSSSCAVYGDTSGELQHEGLPAAPASPYATTKLAGEQMAAEYSRQGLSVISLRYFNVYGPRQNPASAYAAVVPRFALQALQGQSPTIYGDGAQTRDFVFVGDVVRANLCAARLAGHPPAPAVFNVGTGRSTSVNDLWRQIAAGVAGAPAPRYAPARGGEIRHSRADVTRARDILGFTTATSLTEGLRATTDALRS